MSSRLNRQTNLKSSSFVVAACSASVLASEVFHPHCCQHSNAKLPHAFFSLFFSCVSKLCSDRQSSPEDEVRFMRSFSVLLPIPTACPGGHMQSRSISERRRSGGGGGGGGRSDCWWAINGHCFNNSGNAAAKCHCKVLACSSEYRSAPKTCTLLRQLYLCVCRKNKDTTLRRQDGLCSKKQGKL